MRILGLSCALVKKVGKERNCGIQFNSNNPLFKLYFEVVTEFPSARKVRGKFHRLILPPRAGIFASRI